MEQQRAYSFPRSLHLIRCVKLIESIEGDIVEFGVANGDSLALLGAVSEIISPGRRIVGFDSFQSFPKTYTGPFNSIGKTLDPDAQIATVRRVLQTAELNPDGDRVTLVPGYFSETLPGFSFGRIALAHLDVDIPSSYTEALEAIWPHLQSGGIVTFDEYYPELTKYKDAKQAIDAFLSDKTYEDVVEKYVQRRIIRKL